MKKDGTQAVPLLLHETAAQIFHCRSSKSSDGVFDNQLPAALWKLPFDRYLSLQNVKRIVSQADGYQKILIAPEQGYRRLIESGLCL